MFENSVIMDFPNSPITSTTRVRKNLQLSGHLII